MHGLTNVTLWNDNNSIEEIVADMPAIAEAIKEGQEDGKLNNTWFDVSDW